MWVWECSILSDMILAPAYLVINDIYNHGEASENGSWKQPGQMYKRAKRALVLCPKA